MQAFPNSTAVQVHFFTNTTSIKLQVLAQEDPSVYTTMEHLLLPEMDQMVCFKCAIAKDAGQPCVTIAGGAANPKLHVGSWVFQEAVSMTVLAHVYCINL